MFETLIRAGGHRVDYVNDRSMGKEGAFAFYACGELPWGAAYSASAKHSLYAGLSLIEQTWGYENLVAVYLDVASPSHPARPAFCQMKEDLRKGLFRRVFVLRASDLTGDGRACFDLQSLYQEIGGFDLLTFDQGSFRTQCLMECSELV